MAYKLFWLIALIDIFRRNFVNINYNIPYYYQFIINDTIFKVRNNSGFFYVQSGKKTNIHSHHVAEIQYVYSGEHSLSYINSDSKKEYTEKIDTGKLVLIPPNVYHYSTSEPNFTILSFSFAIQPKPDTNSDFFNKIYNTVHSLKAPVVIDDDYMRNVFQLIVNRMVSTNDSSISFDQYHTPFLVTSVLASLMEYLIREYKNEPSNKEAVSFELDREFLIRDYISIAFNQENALENLATLLNVSPRHAQTLVKQITGKNFKSLILEQKMNLANSLIENTNHSLKQISAETGYESYSSFYIAYKNFFGRSPNEYRANND